MKPIILLLALSANAVTNFAQTAAVSLDQHFDERKGMDVFTVTNHDGSPVTAYMFKIEYHNATTGKLDWRAHWFDSLLLPFQEKALQPRETQTIEFSRLTKDTPGMASITAIIFDDGRAQGDTDVINAFYLARRAVLTEIPRAIETIQRAMPLGNDASSLVAELYANAKTSHRSEDLPLNANPRSTPNEEITLYYRNVNDRVATQTANLLRTVPGKMLSDRAKKVIETLKDWEDKLNRSIHG